MTATTVKPSASDNFVCLYSLAVELLVAASTLNVKLRAIASQRIRERERERERLLLLRTINDEAKLWKLSEAISGVSGVIRRLGV